MSTLKVCFYTQMQLFALVLLLPWSADSLHFLCEHTLFCGCALQAIEGQQQINRPSFLLSMNELILFVFCRGSRASSSRPCKPPLLR